MIEVALMIVVIVRAHQLGLRTQKTSTIDKIVIFVIAFAVCRLFARIMS